MKPMAPPVKRGRPGTLTARYFFITRSMTSRPSFTSRPTTALSDRNKFVADEADGTAGEARQTRHAHRAIFFHHALDDFEAVLHVPADDGAFRNAAVLDHLDMLAVLPDDGARIAADERIAPDMFAALDGFKEKRFARAANFAVGRERRFQIGKDAARDGNEISLRRILQKFIQCRRIHETIFSRSAEKTKAGSVSV